TPRFIAEELARAERQGTYPSLVWVSVGVTDVGQGRAVGWTLGLESLGRLDLETDPTAIEPKAMALSLGALSLESIKSPERIADGAVACKTTDGDMVARRRESRLRPGATVIGLSLAGAGSAPPAGSSVRLVTSGPEHWPSIEVPPFDRKNAQ